MDGTGAAAININNKKIRPPNNASIYSAEFQAIKMAQDIIKNSETGKSIVFFDILSSLVAIQEGNQNYPYIQEILETYHYLTGFGKTVVLVWVSSHLSIRGNQIADTLAKEATKMTITTLKLPFTDYKTKFKHYKKKKKRKLQTIWDMSSNNKLYDHQPTIKLDIAKPKTGYNINQNWTHT